jgi:hypothetical protein
MSRHFTIPTMLRMTPNAQLEPFFRQLGVRLYSIDWPRLKERQVEPLQRAISWLSRPEQELVESALANVFELATEPGWQTIVFVAQSLGESNFAALVPLDACVYERAMWTWLHRPEVFCEALKQHQVSSLTRWRKRTGLPLMTPRITDASLRELSVGLSQCLRREEGRGQQCTLEYYRRGDTDYFVASPDDFVQSITTHDDSGNLVSRSLRRTFEIVYALRPDHGTLELSAKVAPAVKPKLEALFGQIILGVDLGLRSYGRPYDLNRLKDRYFCLETDPADGVSASISRLRLSVPHYGRFTVEPEVRGGPADIYELIDECLNRQTVSWDELNISLATFRFEFGARSGSRASLSLDVSYPDRCSIKSRHPDRIDLTRKYLRRWRIANV